MSAASTLAVVAHSVADSDGEEVAPNQSLKELLKAEASDESSEADASTRRPMDDSGEDSGEDSDEAPTVQQADRRKSDMDVLQRQQQTLRFSQRSPSNAATPANASKREGARADGAESGGGKANTAGARQEGDAGESRANKSNSAVEPHCNHREAIVQEGVDEEDEEETANVSPMGKKQSLMSRFFKSKSGLSERSALRAEIGKLQTGNVSMLKEASPEEHNESWYQQKLSIYQRDGLSCTKVATNGKLYDRKIHIDSRNLTMEIRGGRTGEKGLLLDDLVDVKRGMDSAEFELFYARICRSKKDASGSGTGKELCSRACVLVTPHRTFSFVFPMTHLRENLGHCIRYLLTSKNRGVLATGATSEDNETAAKGPKEGPGRVSYKNRSTYEGQFLNYKRHGFGVLTLSDTTRYEAEWRNDERYGEGKEFCPDGTCFAGRYENGMRSGPGEMTWPEGSRYSGHFERGRANGPGQLLRTDGSVYQGQFVEDCMSGEGHMEWRDGVAYSGQFAANKREGHGKMNWASGRWASYEGQWKDGLQHGEGILINHETQAFRGLFGAGKLERWLDSA